MSAPEVTARLLSALALLAAVAWCAYLGGRWLVPEGSRSARLGAAVVVAMALLATTFRLLAALQLFRLPVALLAWAALAAAAHRWLDGRTAWRGLGGELAATWTTLVREVPALTRALLTVGGLLVAARVLRGLVAPALAYDGLLYHLFKPAQWVQAGTLVHQPAPDWWSFLHAYPIGAEILWAWAMLPLHGDGLIAVAGGLVWLGCLLAGVAVARALGATRAQAVNAGAAIVFLPAVVSYLTAAYADTTLLLFLLLAATFIQRAWQDGRAADVLLAAAALGIAASVKHTGLPVAAVGAVLLGLALGRGPGQRRGATAAAALGVAAVLAAPDYLRVWREAGSLLYPLGGRNAELAGLFSGALLPADLLRFDARAFLGELWWGPRGLGWLFPAVAGLAVAAVAGLARRRQTVAATSFLLLATVWMPAVLFSPGYLGLRTFWIYSVSRFVVPFAAALIVLAAAGRRRSTVTLQGFTLLSLLFAVPRGWGDADRHATGELAVLALSGATVVALAWWVGQRAGWPRAATVVGLVAAVATVGPRWDRLRADSRYSIYAEAATGEVFEAHPARLVGWPLWQSVDEESTPHVIAATAGWNGVGHHWARYPLLGTRLQNRVVYLPPAGDGSIIDTREAPRLAAAADEAVWWARLRQAGVDRVVDMGAQPFEERWLAARPDRFQPIATGAGGQGRAYRVVEAAP